ncbi:MAG: hypothetical protein ACU836_14870 [Gammaproteobacteria bacterium]
MSTVKAMGMQRIAAGETITFVGSPPLLSGMLRVNVGGSEKLKLKIPSLAISPAGGDCGDKLPNARLAVAFAADQIGLANAQLQVDQHLAPGVYHACLALSGEQREIVLHVLEHRAVGITPNRFELLTETQKVTVPVLISNDGNVPFSLPRAILVPLGERGALSSGFHLAVAQQGAAGHQAVLDAYAALLAESEIEPVQAHFTNGGRKALEPGEVVATEISFQLPKNLKRHKLYQGRFMVEHTRCSLKLLPGKALS